MFTKNSIQITGNITKEPQTRKVGDTTVTRARLIHNETIRRQDGEDVERLVAIDIDLWGKRGEAFAKHVTSKVPIYIEGRLQLDEWEQDGEPRSRFSVRVDEWQFLMPKTDAREDAPTGGSRNRRGQRVA